MNLDLEWHDLLERIKKKTGRDKVVETKMALYQRAEKLGVEDLPEKPFEEA